MLLTAEQLTPALKPELFSLQTHRMGSAIVLLTTITLLMLWGRQEEKTPSSTSGENTCGDSDSKHDTHKYIFVHICIDINHSYIFKVLYLQTFYAYININLGMDLAEWFKKCNIHNFCKINYLQSKTFWNPWEPILSDKYFLFSPV